MRARLAALVLTALALAGCSGGDGDEESAATAPATTVTRTVTIGGGATGASSPSEGDVFARIPEVVREVEPSVVSVTTDAGEGSGVVWSENGVIVTNQHVVAGASRVNVVLASGASFRARIEAAERRFDLAVLRIDRVGLPAAEFREDLPEVGELAIAMGNPLGFEESVTAGIISGRHRSIPSGGTTPALVDLLQTDAAISPGNSGGALVDAESRVVGINVAYLPPQQTGAVALGFAIPAATVVRVVRQLLETGRAKVAILGIQPVQVTPELATQFGLGVDHGAAVEDVSSGGGAARAGIRPGDVIVSLDGKRIETVEDLFAELNRRKPGDRVSVVVVRDGDRRTFDVTLGAA
jgi:S1-C subfamily serine protease